MVLFFEKGRPTEKIWYYQLNPGRKMGKTNSLNQQDMEDFVELAGEQARSDNSWLVQMADINQDTWDLTVSNTNRVDVTDTHTPDAIIVEIEALDVRATQALQEIKKLL